ncbi:DUF3309 family protein [Ectothiorhodospiraceae bacterium 2226]|nr:DUF3309 family protein [Ectothiorhodospiraceae bacterium 2226]
MDVGLLLIVALVLVLLGALPMWPYSARWGYMPGGVIAAFLLMVVVLVALGQL